VTVQEFEAAVDDHLCFLDALGEDVRNNTFPVRRLCRATRGIVRLTAHLCDITDLLGHADMA
jgi:hypothetical protein